MLKNIVSILVFCALSVAAGVAFSTGDGAHQPALASSGGNAGQSENSPAQSKAPEGQDNKVHDKQAEPSLTLNSWLVGGIGLATASFLVGCFLWVGKGTLEKTSDGRDWRISDALSEETTLLTSEGKSMTVLVASTSRVIAMFGMIVVLTIFLGVGLVVVFDLAINGRPPKDLDLVMKLLVAGGSLFAPYLFNQVKGAFEKKA